MFSQSLCKVNYSTLIAHIALPYPAICLLIASEHAGIVGHETFTFAMLHEAFQDQVRISKSAPVQIAGGGISMIDCDKDILIGVSTFSCSNFVYS